MVELNQTLIRLLRIAKIPLGLLTLSDIQPVSQIIFSFIPTFIATLLVPFWVLVGHYLTLYQPYIKLR